jgi:hypothetical protein
MNVNWQKPVLIPLWVWALYWALQLLGAPNIFAAIVAGILLVYPFVEKS